MINGDAIIPFVEACLSVAQQVIKAAAFKGGMENENSPKRLQTVTNGSSVRLYTFMSD
jgi:hypothetical protein